MAQQINVDIKPGAFQLQPTLYFSQGDIGREFAVKIVASDGFTIPVDATAELVGTKPSGFGFTVPCTIADGIVSFTATDTDGQVFTDEAGRFMAEIRIEDDGDVIGTANFYLQGEKDPHPEGTVDGEAEQIIPILAQLVTRIEAAADDVDEKYPIITQAKTDAVNAKNDAVSAKDDAVLAKAGAESAAEDAEDAKDTVLASLDAAFITETAQGSIASFTDGANVPVKSLVADIVPLQSGSGDPSPDNVRPITGWTKAEIHVADGESPHIVDNVKTINWQSQAGTVYGGSIDVTTGVLTVDWGGINIGDENWTYSPSPNEGFYCDSVGAKPAESVALLPNAISSIFKVLDYNEVFTKAEDNIFGVRTNGGLRVYTSLYTDASTFKTAMNGQTIAFELETPQTHQLTPTEVKTLLGNNNVWADTGDIDLTYRADLGLYLDKIINA